jgi:hypothetical protein
MARSVPTCSTLRLGEVTVAAQPLALAPAVGGARKNFGGGGGVCGRTMRVVVEPGSPMPTAWTSRRMGSPSQYDAASTCTGPT